MSIIRHMTSAVRLSTVRADNERREAVTVRHAPGTLSTRATFRAFIFAANNPRFIGS